MTNRFLSTKGSTCFVEKYETDLNLKWAAISTLVLGTLQNSRIECPISERSLFCIGAVSSKAARLYKVTVKRPRDESKTGSGLPASLIEL
jgi:hypothetical protein